MRGEYRSAYRYGRSYTGSSPLARGVLSLSKTFLEVKRIIPACAGSTNQTAFFCSGSWDHPRLRGEYKFDCVNRHKLIGSSPLARGVPRKQFRNGFRSGIIPACAGSTERGQHCESPSWDHPRLRGEYTKKSLILRDPCLLV